MVLSEKAVKFDRLVREIADKLDGFELKDNREYDLNSGEHAVLTLEDGDDGYHRPINEKGMVIVKANMRWGTSCKFFSNPMFVIRVSKSKTVEQIVKDIQRRAVPSLMSEIDEAKRKQARIDELRTQVRDAADACAEVFGATSPAPNLGPARAGNVTIQVANPASTWQQERYTSVDDIKPGSIVIGIRIPTYEGVAFAEALKAFLGDRSWATTS